MVAFLLFFLFGVAAEGVRREVRFLVLLLRADFVVLVAMSLSFYCVWMWISRPVALVYPFSRLDSGEDAVEVQGRRWRRYGTPVTLNDDEAADKAADALQAAYFRRSLCHGRAQLLDEISKRRDDIAKRTDRGTTHAIHRLGSHLRSVEAQVRYLDQLIARLDHRFANRPDGRN